MYDSEDFRDSIDDMCDDAVRRMFAFREGGLMVMQPNDAYYSQVERRDELLDIIEFDTVTRAEIIDSIHSNTVESEIPDYFRDILTGAVIALARHAQYLGRGSDIIVPNYGMARNWVDDALLMGQQTMNEKNGLQIIRYELGAIGATNLLLSPGEDTWSLLYEAHNRTSLVRFRNDE